MLWQDIVIMAVNVVFWFLWDIFYSTIWDRNKNMNEILLLGKYEHYKGKYYEVIGMAKHSRH